MTTDLGSIGNPLQIAAKPEHIKPFGEILILKLCNGKYVSNN